MPGLGEVTKAIKMGTDCIVKWFDVEYPLKQIGAPKTAIELKNTMSRFGAADEKALQSIIDLHKFEFKEGDFSKIALAAENTNNVHPDDLVRLSPAIQYIRKIFDDALDELHKEAPEKFSEMGFPATRIKKNEALIEAMERNLKENVNTHKVLSLAGQILGQGSITTKDELDALDKIIKQAHGEINGKKVSDTVKEILRLKQENNYLKDQNIKYVHIPIRIWFEDILKELGGFKEILGRKSLGIKSLIDAGIITLKQVDIRDIIASYLRYKNRQIALNKIVKAARSEGLVKAPGEDDTFTSPPQRLQSFMPNEVVHPVFAHAVDDYFKSGDDEPGIGKVLALFKAASFVNPLVLPTYGIFHNTAAGAVFPVKQFDKALKAVTSHNSDYFLAYENGAFSKPYANPYDKFREQIDKLKQEQDRPENKLLKAISHIPYYARHPGIALKDLYTVNFNISWMLEKSLRMTTFYHFLDQGFSPRDAAQLTAAYHSDYARVPPNTRRTLNKIMWTPSFEISMFRLDSQMLEAAIKGGLMPTKSPSIKNKLAWGLISSLGIVTAMDGWMIAHGFKRDTFSRRYHKTVDTDEGPKDINVVFSNPLNIPWRIWDGIKPRAFPEEWKHSATNAIVNRLNPFHRIGVQIATNQASDGRPIYNDADPSWLNGLRVIGYGIKEAIPWFKYMDVETSTGDQAKRKELMQKEFGKLGAMLTSYLSFSYVSKSSNYKLKSAFYSYMKDFKQLTHGHPSVQELQEFKNRTDKFIQEHQGDISREDVESLEDRWRWIR